MGPRLEDLYRVETYLTKNGCSDFVYDEDLDVFASQRIAASLSARSLPIGSACRSGDT
jgi:hypothetical protein